jgi:hypothetical protein
MGTCMTSPVKSAEARLASLQAALKDLTDKLEECKKSSNPAQYQSQLLAQADDLLALLAKEVKRMKEETAEYGYDTSGFDTLSFQIQGFKVDVQNAVITSGVRAELMLKLGGAPKGRADLEWFHGTYMSVAIKILDTGHLDASATGGAGKKFGPGTYFTQALEKTAGYGDCVFGISVAGFNILRVRDTPLDPGNPFGEGGLEVLTGGISAEELKEIRAEANSCVALTRLAQQKGYDAIEFIVSSEGHILIVLKNIKVDGTNVVYLKEY